jgi:hypothetical protein
MPRRALLLLTALVLALHALALLGLPDLTTRLHSPEVAAFSTRSIALPPPQPAPTAPPRPRPPPKPKPKPKPAPAAPDPLPELPADALPTDATTLAATTAGDITVPIEPSLEPAEAAEPPAAPAPAASEALAAAPAPEQPASAPQESASAPADPPEPRDPGLAITLPGGASAQAGGAAPPPVRVPPPTRLAFEVSGEVKRFHYSASAEMLWKHDGTHYEARQEIRAFLIGSRAQTSVGQLTAHGLQPRRFGDRVRSEQAAHFDFDQGRITFSANTPSAPIAPGAQDRLSVFIELASLIAAAPERYPEGTEIALTTASARAAGRWVFRVGQTEPLELPAGTITALKLQRVPEDEHDQRADLWLAPSVHYLPVRLRITQSSGDFVDLRLKETSTP